MSDSSSQRTLVQKIDRTIKRSRDPTSVLEVNSRLGRQPFIRMYVALFQNALMRIDPLMDLVLVTAKPAYTGSVNGI